MKSQLLLHTACHDDGCLRVPPRSLSSKSSQVPPKTIRTDRVWVQPPNHHSNTNHQLPIHCTIAPFHHCATIHNCISRPLPTTNPACQPFHATTPCHPIPPFKHYQPTTKQAACLTKSRCKRSIRRRFNTRLRFSTRLQLGARLLLIPLPPLRHCHEVDQNLGHFNFAG